MFFFIIIFSGVELGVGGGEDRDFCAVLRVDSGNKRIICRADLSGSKRHNTEPFDATRLGVKEVV